MDGRWSAYHQELTASERIDCFDTRFSEYVSTSAQNALIAVFSRRALWQEVRVYLMDDALGVRRPLHRP